MLEFVLTDEKQRQKILKCAEPSVYDTFSYQNINLAYGVQDKEKGFFLTLVYYVSDMIKRCDDGYDDYAYVILTRFENYTVSCTQRYGGEIKNLSCVAKRISNLSENDIVDAIKFYRNNEELNRFENSVKEKFNGKALWKIVSEYRDNWVKENQ